MACISLCVIDDCRDVDVPLLEATTSHLFLRHSIDPSSGACVCQLSIEYYNRVLSGWEPFLEPFKCSLKWNFHSEPTAGKFFFSLCVCVVVDV